MKFRKQNVDVRYAYSGAYLLKEILMPISLLAPANKSTNQETERTKMLNLKLS